MSDDRPGARGLAPLVTRYGLNASQEGQLESILRQLAVDDLAPSSVREPALAVDVHLADSLVALELEQVATARVLTDLGAGAGFPGLALAVALPASEVVLVESQARKCSFIERAIALAGIENARALCVRAEEWGDGRDRSDVTLARALAPQAVVLEYAAPLLRRGGALVDWRGRRDAAEEATATCAARELGLRLVEIRRVEPYATALNHHLHVYEKVHETPARYPRRPGIARKRSLGC